MTVPDPFLSLWILTRICGGIISVKARKETDLRFPLGVSIGFELRNLITLFRIIIGKPSYGSIHDVAGDSLFSSFKIVILLLVCGTIISIPITNVREIDALFDIRHVGWIILKNAVNELEGIWRC